MNYVFILGCHKSGTSLLRHLLDGSKGTVTFPFESHFLAALGHSINYPMRAQKGWVTNMNKFIEYVTLLVESYNEGNSKSSDINLNRKFDLKIFTEEINRVSDNYTLAELFHVYLTAVTKSLNYELIKESKTIIEKSVEHAEHAVTLKKIFPAAKFIHIIRNPYSNIVSLRKFKSADGKYPSLAEICLSLKNSYTALTFNSRYFDNDDYHVIRYEDLIENTKNEMTRIANFLNMEYSRNMINPTSFGAEWLGNSTTNLSKSGIYKVDQRPTNLESKLVKIMFEESLEQYYEFDRHTQIRLSKTIRMMKGESLKTYIRNRTFQLFADLNF